MPLSDLLQDIVSYDEGIERSNAGAVTLARFRLTNEREQFVEQQTGNDLQFMGGYGFRPMYDQPEIVTCSGEIVATAPAHSGQVGPNHTSAYDLTRIMAMATWHTHLDQDQRLPGAQWHSIESVMRAMGEDSARYVDAAIEKLGVEDILGDVVVATKLGHGIRDATKNETVYSKDASVQRPARVPPLVGRELHPEVCIRSRHPRRSNGRRGHRGVAGYCRRALNRFDGINHRRTNRFTPSTQPSRRPIAVWR